MAEVRDIFTGDLFTKVVSFIIPTVAGNTCPYDISSDWPWQVLNRRLGPMTTPLSMRTSAESSMEKLLSKIQFLQTESQTGRNAEGGVGQALTIKIE